MQPSTNKTMFIMIAAHIATAVVTLLAVRWYTHWYILPAANQAAFIDSVKSEKALVEFLDSRYVRRDTQSKDEQNREEVK